MPQSWISLPSTLPDCLAKWPCQATFRVTHGGIERTWQGAKLGKEEQEPGRKRRNSRPLEELPGESLASLKLTRLIPKRGRSPTSESQCHWLLDPDTSIALRCCAKLTPARHREVFRWELNPIRFKSRREHFPRGPSKVRSIGKERVAMTGTPVGERAGLPQSVRPSLAVGCDPSPTLVAFPRRETRS